MDVIISMYCTRWTPCDAARLSPDSSSDPKHAIKNPPRLTTGKEFILDQLKPVVLAFRCGGGAEKLQPSNLPGFLQAKRWRWIKFPSFNRSFFFVFFCLKIGKQLRYPDFNGRIKVVTLLHDVFEHARFPRPYSNSSLFSWLNPQRPRLIRTLPWSLNLGWWISKVSVTRTRSTPEPKRQNRTGPFLSTTFFQRTVRPTPVGHHRFRGHGMLKPSKGLGRRNLQKVQ